MCSGPCRAPPPRRQRRYRRDLRDYNICSVDPPGCTDIDDALHVRPLDNGNYEIGVHIADVSHFLRPGTALDVEASKRGTTVYLANRRSACGRRRRWTEGWVLWSAEKVDVEDGDRRREDQR